METWALILMIILILAVGAMVVVVYLTEKKNTTSNQKNILYPFTGKVKSNGTVSLTNSQGQPQIDCSTESGKNGGTINIVGAFMDIIDPYGECSPIASSVLDLTCGIPGGKISCTKQADCGGGMKCSGGFCTPATAKLSTIPGAAGIIDTSNSECTSVGGSYCPIQPGTPCDAGKDDCNDSSGEIMKCVPTTSSSSSGTCQVNPSKSCYGVNTKHGTCAIYPLCSNATITGKTVSNNMCGVNTPQAYSKYGCMSRDASAYLAGKCDGKDTCAAMWNVSVPEGGFGPLPCSTSDVSGLPIIPGQGGSFSQEYKVHGVYGCLPKGE